MLFISILSFVIALGANLFHRDGDLPMHLALGRAILDHGDLPNTDIYSHTMAGGTMVPHEWLSQVVLAGTHRLFGFVGLLVLTAVLTALPWYLVYRYLVRRGDSVAVSLGLSIGGGLASVVHLATRPHLFTWMFFVIWLVALEKYRLGDRHHLWLLVPLTVVWANLHGAFVIGFVLLGTYLAGLAIEQVANRPGQRSWAKPRHLGAVLVLSIAASLANPAGFEGSVFGISYLGNDYLLEFTAEYGSPDFHSPTVWPFLILLLLSVVAPTRWSWPPALLAVSWTAFALYSFRNVPLAAIVMVLVLAKPLSAVWRRLAPRWRMSPRISDYVTLERNAGGWIVALAAVAALGLWTATSDRAAGLEFSSDYFPIDAIESLPAEVTEGRVFNAFHWGGYLEYCCPDIPVFIDGRTDYFGEALTRQYAETVRGGPEWSDILTEYDIDWVLIEPEAGLAQVLSASEMWRETYRDGTAVVFTPK